jgi:thiazole synthase ThiGH ThiG subunit
MAAQWVQRGQDPASMAYAMAQAMGYQPKAADAERMHDEGYKASKPSGGGSGRGKYSVRQIANMTPSQLARMSDDDFKAAMGG